MEIRKATSNDIPELASLMEQLGYPTSVEQMRIRFSNIESNPSYHTLVAEYDGKVVGMIGLCTGVFYELDGSYVRIVALVVDSNYRSKGIGRKLIEEAESWAKRQGAISIGVNSGNRTERLTAHQFYINMGYEQKSIGFAKKLI
ncbi:MULTISPECIES: GNAT family N-acetyltransferase [Bacillaceae]|jgi:GNAT superfamily N-acetyltransferase|uniref:GNAT family acetyltransferase n=2 Tax=Anoxybacillaceae TaxID=3120669 RepID=A0A7U9JDF4_GEOTM|nr:MULTISPECIES: GNAT family N-acetyltransferase [Bacillaceae]AKM18320.1 aminoalkylphosphonic acid N-acetyltransferase [Geobacillus sp. 12AMOR1]KZM57728.1 GNAT family acetyltransferase [Geobacillus stearothermophilus]MED4973694.1 GNAT family N-acetyltransferase [Geobacillus thermoleovorans]STO11518.1 aminoalkylphosphonic acid N-acetyltransferase [[Flavobacterium] thermophilum]ESU73444.1 GNAT family acetyltransferase [Geobacillus sp. MAS1]